MSYLPVSLSASSPNYIPLKLIFQLNFRRNTTEVTSPNPNKVLKVAEYRSFIRHCASYNT